MADPEETRKRIKEMRERIFKEADKVSVKNQIEKDAQETNSAPQKSLDNGEISLEEKKIKNHLKDDLSKEIQKNDDKISIIDTDIQKQVSELTLDFDNKSNTLKTEILEKIEGNFSENNSKIDGIEKLVNYNITNSSQTNKAFKERLEELNRALQLEINSVNQKLLVTNESHKKELSELSNSLESEVSSVEKRFASANQKVKTELSSNSDKLSKFEKSIENSHHSLEKTFFEKLQQNDDKISELSSDTNKLISEITLDFASKQSSLETEILKKIEHTFTESKFKIDSVEKLVSDNSFNFTQLIKALKERMNDLTGSFNLELNSVVERLTSENKKIEIELHKKSDELLRLDKSLEEKQTILKENLSEKLQKSDEKLTTLNSNIQKKISEISLNLDNKSSTLEKEFLETIEKMSIHLNSVKEQIENQIGYLNTSLRGYILSITTDQLEKIETELQNNFERSLNFEKLIIQQHDHLKDDLSKEIQKNDDKISIIDTDIQKQVSELTLDFDNKSNTLKTEILEKIEGNFSENNSKIDGIEKLVNYNITNSSQTNKAFKERLEELNRALQLEINSVNQKLLVTNESHKKELSELSNSLESEVSSVEKRFASANQKVKTELSSNSDKLSKFEKSIENSHHSLEKTFFEKLQQNDDKISELSSDTNKLISEITLDFASKQSSLETEFLEKLEHTNLRVGNVEEQIENQIGYLNSSLRGYILTTSKSQEEKVHNLEKEIYSLQERLQTEINSIRNHFLEQKVSIEDTVAKYVVETSKKIDDRSENMQNSLKFLRQEFSDSQRDMQTSFDKKVKESELKTIDHLTKKFLEVRKILSEKIKSLSGDLTILDDILKEKYSALSIDINNGLTALKKDSEKDRKNFNDQFKKAFNEIQLVESTIVKEDDLTELFKNYTLNVNISGNHNLSKE